MGFEAVTSSLLSHLPDYKAIEKHLEGKLVKKRATNLI